MKFADSPGHQPDEPTPASAELGAFPYRTAASFRTALKDRFTAIARDGTGYTVDELQRQFAYDRVLARVFTGEDSTRWVLKGAGALLARLENARHSKDIDLFYADKSAAVDEAVTALRLALGRDIGDFFAFEVTKIVRCRRTPRVHGSTSRLGWAPRRTPGSTSTSWSAP